MLNLFTAATLAALGFTIGTLSAEEAFLRGLVIDTQAVALGLIFAAVFALVSGVVAIAKAAK